MKNMVKDHIIFSEMWPNAGKKVKVTIHSDKYFLS